MAEKEAENNEDLMSEFQEFLEAKHAKEKEAADNEDFDVEIWDEKGRGVRTKRSHAKPFLQSLGIDLDPEPPDGDESGDKAKPKTTNRKAAPSGSTSVTRKYFTGKK